jgi:hypothetical protein
LLLILNLILIPLLLFANAICKTTKNKIKSWRSESETEDRIWHLYIEEGSIICLNKNLKQKVSKKLYSKLCLPSFLMVQEIYSSVCLLFLQLYSILSSI